MLELDAPTGHAAVQALHGKLSEASDAITDAAGFLRDMEQRMRIAPVCIASDIALPHARTNAVSRLVMGVARTRQPVAFDAAHPNVRLIFMIGTPQAAVTAYLQAVATLSRMLRKPAIREGLYAATDEAEFRALLSGGVSASR